MFNKIKSLFKKTKQIEYKFDIVKAFNLNPNLGLTTPNCPYCNAELDKFPIRKTKCASCGNYMYVRTRCSDRKKILIKKEEIELVEEDWNKIDWDKKRFLENLENKKSPQAKNKNSNSNLGIDVSDKIKEAINDFSVQYKTLCNYDEINSIKEKDRLKLLIIAWNNFSQLSRNVVPKMQFEFPQYNKQVLEFIFAVEASRITAYCHMLNYLQTRKVLKKCSDFVEYYTSEESSSFYDANFKKSKQTWARLVRIEDMVKAVNVHKKPNGRYSCYIYHTPMFINSNKGQILTIYLYVDKTYIKMTTEEFKKHCKENNYKYPL